jgi:hypothetical protein
MLSVTEVQNIINLAIQSPVLRVGGNSTITRVDFEQRSYAVKDYSARTDGYQRLTQEFSALEFLHPELPDRFTEPLGIGSGSQRAIYSWLNGTRPVLDQECVTHMLDIASELHLLSKSVTPEQVNPATDQVLIISDLCDQLVKRFETLQAAPSLVADFTKTRAFPLLLELMADHNEIGQAAATLSPSDFGAHNLLWDHETEQMRCIDLEFFGWDDSHKLTCDSLLHPLAQWSADAADTFLLGTVATYTLDEARLIGMWPLLNLKWAAITLARAQRKLQSGDTTLADQAVRLATAYVDRASQETDSLSDIVQQVALKRRSP